MPRCKKKYGKCYRVYVGNLNPSVDYTFEMFKEFFRPYPILWVRFKKIMVKDAQQLIAYALMPSREVAERFVKSFGDVSWFGHKLVLNVKEKGQDVARHDIENKSKQHDWTTVVIEPSPNKTQIISNGKGCGQPLPAFHTKDQRDYLRQPLWSDFAIKDQCLDQYANRQKALRLDEPIDMVQGGLMTGHQPTVDKGQGGLLFRHQPTVDIVQGGLMSRHQPTVGIPQGCLLSQHQPTSAAPHVPSPDAVGFTLSEILTMRDTLLQIVPSPITPLLLGHKVQVLITCVISSTFFWGQIVDTKSQQQLNNISNKLKTFRPRERASGPGLCLAVFHGDKQWYRALITPTGSEQNMAGLFYLDYGNMAKVPWTQTACCCDTWLWELQPQARPFSLTDPVVNLTEIEMKTLWVEVIALGGLEEGGVITAKAMPLYPQVAQTI